MNKAGAMAATYCNSITT